MSNSYKVTIKYKGTTLSYGPLVAIDAEHAERIALEFADMEGMRWHSSIKAVKVPVKRKGCISPDDICDDCPACGGYND